MIFCDIRYNSIEVLLTEETQDIQNSSLLKCIAYICTAIVSMLCNAITIENPDCGTLSLLSLCTRKFWVPILISLLHFHRFFFSLLTEARGRNQNTHVNSFAINITSNTLLQPLMKIFIKEKCLWNTLKMSLRLVTKFWGTAY